MTSSLPPPAASLLVDVDTLEEPSAIVVLVDIQAHPRHEQHDDED